jgi:hypothetical protein
MRTEQTSGQRGVGEAASPQRESRKGRVLTALGTSLAVAGLAVTAATQLDHADRPFVIGVAVVLIAVIFAWLARPEGKMLLAVLAAAAALYPGLITLAKAFEPKHEDGRLRAGGVQVTVLNKVTSGADGTVEDEPLVLFTSPALCRAKACVIDGYSFKSGDRISNVICQVPHGDRLTNGNDNSRTDNKNPALVESTRWLGARLHNGRMAYFNEVWVEPKFRGGLKLPRCKRG